MVSSLMIIIESGITFLLQLNVAICFGIIILYWRLIIKKQKNFSLDLTLSVSFYITSEFISTLLCMPYTLYLIIFWRQDFVIYNAYWLLFTGAIHTLAMISNTVTVFYLGIDRCLYVINPLTAKRWSLLLFWLTLSTMILFSSVDAVFHLWNAIPNSSKTECQTFACLVSNESGQWYTVIRITVCIANMLVGIALICLVKIKTVSKSAILKTTRLVLVTILMDLLFVFIPHLTSFCLLTFWGFGVSKYVGPYSLLVTTINSSFCGFVYFKVMKKSIKKSSIHASIAPVMIAIE